MFTSNRQLHLLISLPLLVLSACSLNEAPTTQENLVQDQATRECSDQAFAALPEVALSSISSEVIPVPHCKVKGLIGTETNFELLLPDDWNGKFVMGGGGGFVGSVVNYSLVYGSLQKGYATVGTDTGHQASSLDASWALNNMDRIVNFGHLAVHRTAVTGKALSASYYGEAADKNYFVGCSRGGGQALMEAQRYPADFDGIVAGAPAHNWTHQLGARNTWVNQVMYPNPEELGEAVISPTKVRLIGEAVMRQCDGLDGLEDGIINNPLVCDFDVSTLLCDDIDSSTCLAEEQVAAAQRIYTGVRDDQGPLYPGMPVGGELSVLGWGMWFTGGLNHPVDVSAFHAGSSTVSDYPAPVVPNAHFAFGNGVMKYLVYHDPAWNYTDYDFKNFRDDVALVAPTLNATDPDISSFRERGGKLLMWSGWADMALSPLGTIEYYEQVLEHDATAVNDVRLIMMPGVDHCAGGAGPFAVDYLDAIDTWIETSAAPDQMRAYWLNEKMQPEGSRPVCAYPKHLLYNGSGDIRNASNFSCKE